MASISVALGKATSRRDSPARLREQLDHSIVNGDQQDRNGDENVYCHLKLQTKMTSLGSGRC